MSLIVFDNPRTHLLSRGVAGFVFAPYIYLQGVKHNDQTLKFIGIATFVFDLWTFKLTLDKIPNKI